MKKILLLAMVMALSVLCVFSAGAEVTTKTVHMGDREIVTEVVDLGISGTFTYWSAFTGDSATWDQERMDDLRIWFPELGEAKEPPEWVNQVMDLIFCLLLIFILCLVLRSIYRYFLAFRGTHEENGDIAVRLEDQTRRQARQKRNRRFPGFNRIDPVRRRYRRVILRYRKEKPLPAQTPAQIEADTPFPPGFPIREFHETYEQTRYGPEPSPASPFSGNIYNDSV